MNPRFLFSRSFRLVLLLLLAALPARAEVRLHGLFTDNMVLQRHASVPVWGWAADGEEVTVQFRDQKVSTVAKGGKWMVRLKNLKAGGPDELKVTGRNGLTLRNVLVGEVWIASGQSNMEMALRSCFNAEAEIAATANPMLRLCTVPKLKANAPVDDVTAPWAECGPATTPGFSAVAYYFARDLQKALQVPVGVIHTSWGGSPAEVWMREEVLSANPGFKRDILDSYAAGAKRAQEALATWQKEEAEAKKEGQPFTKRRPSLAWKPGELYNGMIANLIPYAIKGAIWYQGESNAGRAHQYRTLFPEMVRHWRHDWGQGDFTFLQVQLAPFTAIRAEPTNSNWAELREAQIHATKVLPKAGSVVITDVGEEKDIHPKKKEPVGARLALAARAITYGEKIVYSGPTYKSAKFRDGQAIISFDHVGQGLEARSLGGLNMTFSPDGKQLVTTGSDGAAHVWDASTGKLATALRGFSVAGEDQKFFWAKAEIQGDKVVLSSPDVPRPVAARFGWADFPVVNLWNKDGLPASPFRTDDFPMVTAPKLTEVKK